MRTGWPDECPFCADAYDSAERPALAVTMYDGMQARYCADDGCPGNLARWLPDGSVQSASVAVREQLMELGGTVRPAPGG